MISVLVMMAAVSAVPVAFVDCEVRTVSGPTLARATVVVEGEQIRRVGPDAPVPADARRFDCEGKVLTPGLIEPNTVLGLVEIGLEPMSNDAEVTLVDPVRAALRAQDAIDPRSSLLAVARRHGVTAALVLPQGGIVAGQGAFLELVHPRSVGVDDAVSGPVALVASYGEDGAMADGTSRLVNFTRLREFFDDANTYRKNKAAFQRRGLYAMPWSRLDLEAAEPVMQGRMPLVVRVHRASDIVSVLEWAKNERIEVILEGVAEGWMVASRIAEAKVPVIVDPMLNLPVRFEARHARSDNATLLDQAGVQVMLTTGSAHLAANLRFQAGIAVREGMSPDRALAAITQVPAQSFGRRKLGIIEPGALANLVMWTGDPFEPTSHAETVLIRGQVQPTESRQTDLAERYLKRLKPPANP